MKKITIGRGRECDIRIDDTAEKVSRRHAVITVSPVGKMKIYDTSSNGTFVNGEKVEKPAGMPLKRGDKVNFAHLVDLDWERVRNPYRKMWIGSGLFLAVALGVILILWIVGEDLINRFSSQEEVKTEAVVDSISPVNDSLRLEVPVEKKTVVVRPDASNVSSEKKNQTTARDKNVAQPKEKSTKTEDSREKSMSKEMPKPVTEPDPALEELRKEK